MTGTRARRTRVSLASAIAGTAIAVVLLPAPAPGVIARPTRGSDPPGGGVPPGHGGVPPGHGGKPPGHGGKPPGQPGNNPPPSPPANPAPPNPAPVQPALGTTPSPTPIGPADTPQPAPSAVPPSASTTAAAPTVMNPFPIVRIQGRLLPRGAMITRLVVSAPGGARIRAVCRGPGCPRRSVVRRARSALLPVRLRPLERWLGVGERLRIFVTDAGAVGKYTRFTIRRGVVPARRDRCMPPSGQRPVHCPSA